MTVPLSGEMLPVNMSSNGMSQFGLQLVVSLTLFSTCFSLSIHHLLLYNYLIITCVSHIFWEENNTLYSRSLLRSVLQGCKPALICVFAPLHCQGGFDFYAPASIDGGHIVFVVSLCSSVLLSVLLSVRQSEQL